MRVLTSHVNGTATTGPPPTLRAVPAATAPTPLVPPPLSKTIVDGKPTADHPWRRSSPFRVIR